MDVCILKDGNVEIIADDRNLVEVIRLYCGDNIADLVEKKTQCFNEYQVLNNDYRRLAQDYTDLYDSVQDITKKLDKNDLSLEDVTKELKKAIEL